MRSWLIFLILHVLAAALPFFQQGFAWSGTCEQALPPFPDVWEGRSLEPRPLNVPEDFLEGFPGEMARFSDGEVEYLMRWVSRPTRQLHSTAVCFRGLGYTITEQPVHVDARSRQWSCFEAELNGAVFRGFMSIEDADGKTWYDASSWFWDASMGRSRGPWLAVTKVTAAE